jgi:cholesterol oxidase
MLTDEMHEAAMIGSLECSALSKGPMSVTRGRFKLFVKSPEDSRVRLMVYQATFHAINGDAFRLHGVKIIKPGWPTKAWAATTTLYATISRAGPEGETVVGRGVLRIGLMDFLRQLASFDVVCSSSRAARLFVLAGYLRFFAGVLLTVYFGGVFRRSI